MSPNTVVQVRICRLPLGLHHRAQQHNEELMREFRLMAEQAPEASAGVPRRLLDLVQALTGRYAGLTEEQESQIQQAISSGEPFLDEIVFNIPRHAADASLGLGAMLDEADEFCRAGEHLLTLATPPDLVAYRRWYLNEFVAQIGGAEPTPWAGTS